MNFTDFLRVNGLDPREVIEDGLWHRCRTTLHPKKKNGTYKYLGTVGFCQDFATHSEVQIWKADGESKQAKIDHKLIAERRRQERAATDRAIAGARSFYAACAPLKGGHPYLTAHGLEMDGCLGLRIDREGWLVVPMYVPNEFGWQMIIKSVQRISPNGDKKFWPGAPVKSTFYPITRHRFSLTVICEGLATGLAIFAAVPTCRVLVAFNAGNLTNVSARGLAVIAADNDHATEARLGYNPGVKAATEAANRLGVGVAIPSGTGTDWCDYREERYRELREAKPKARDGDIRRAVDAEINAAMMRQARLCNSVASKNHS